LDLKEKSVGSIMIPMEDVFTMSADDVLDEKTMDLILSQGYSRIPIHAPDNPENFVGMLLVKMLITYDPEDCKQVRDFALATLPETRAETSCLDIVNFFQEGKSHMVLVSEYPGEDHGALGVVTLEDVIEELIGEYVIPLFPFFSVCLLAYHRLREIIDESDVFIDVHKAIRRLAPAPKSRVPKGKIITEPPQIPPPRPQSDIDGPEDGATKPEPQAELIPKPSNPATEYASPPHTTFYMRRPRAIAESGESTPIARRAPTAEIREHLKHLGPSNLASRPRQTRYNNVKIKRGSLSPSRSSQMNYEVVDSHAPDSARRASESASLLGVQNGIKSGGKTASDAIRALRASYGTIADQPAASTVESESADHPDTVNKGVGTGDDLLDILPHHLSHRRSRNSRERLSIRSDHVRSPSGASDSAPTTPPYITRGPTRTGSITEQYVDSNGIRKVILETTESHPPSDEDLSRRSSAEKQPTEGEDTEGHQSMGSATHSKHKKRSRRKKPWRSKDQTAEDDSKPLLDL
jgi:metal transporter CNNM